MTRAADQTGTGAFELDPADLDAVYRACWPGLVRLAWLLTGSREEAEDVAQDAFVRYRAAAPGVTTPRAYLRQIVVNEVRDRSRRAVRRRARDALLRTEPVLTDDANLIWQLLADLPARQRAALVLRFYEDLPVDEVAAVLCCPTGTAKSLISRGVSRLRKDLDHDD